MKQVLFLCTGNSCRSQMAEGLIKHYLGDEWRAYSAGTVPAGYVHPLAIDVMRELGIHIENQRSKPVDAVRDVPFDLVVTVCDAAAENCPVWLGRGRKVHLGFEDPAKASGTEDERRAEFRRVRDEMRQRLFDCLVNGR